MLKLYVLGRLYSRSWNSSVLLDGKSVPRIETSNFSLPHALDYTFLLSPSASVTVLDTSNEGSQLAFVFL